MTRVRRYLLSSLAVPLSTAAFVGNAAAAEPDPPASDPATVAAVEPPTTVAATTPTEPSTASGGVSVTSTSEPLATPRFPRAVIARPLTLPEGVAALGADATSNKDFSSTYGAPIAGYGFTDKAELQVGYAFATHELEPRGSLAADAGYVVLRGAVDGKLEVVARARAGYDVLGEVPTPLMVGLHAQYNVTPWLALISGTPGSQQLAFSVADNADDAKPAFVQLPVAVGVQPTELVYVQLDTKLGRIGLHDSEHALIGKDETPLALTIVYNVLNALDLQASVGADVSNKPGDTLSLLVGARFYAGEL